MIKSALVLISVIFIHDQETLVSNDSLIFLVLLLIYFIWENCDRRLNYTEQKFRTLLKLLKDYIRTNYLILKQTKEIRNN